MSMQSGSDVVFPPGVRVTGASETSQVASNGQIEQGMRFTFVLPSGASTSVFIPYLIIHDTAAVAAAVSARVAAIQAIEGLGQ